MKRKRLMLFLVSFGLLSSVFAQEKMKPEDTEVWEPVPPVVTPGEGTAPPSDAIVLFDGKDFSQWVNKEGKEPKWEIKEDIMTVVKGTGEIATKRKFGDIQLHLEWRSPTVIEGEGQGRGNSGVFLQGRYEVQVLDSYENRTYSNGQASSVYKQHAPLVNAMRKTGEWQTYDIIFMAPRFTPQGELEIPARVTVLHNGILVQNNVVLDGPTEYIGIPEYKPHGKDVIKLQDHSNPVSFRNIWVREL